MISTVVPDPRVLSFSLSSSVLASGVRSPILAGITKSLLLNDSRSRSLVRGEIRVGVARLVPLIFLDVLSSMLMSAPLLR